MHTYVSAQYYLCYPRVRVAYVRVAPTRAPSGTGRRCGARLLSLPDSLAAWRPTGYALPSPPLPPPPPAHLPRRTLSPSQHTRRSATFASSSFSLLDLSRVSRFILLPATSSLFAPFPTTSPSSPMSERVALKKLHLSFFNCHFSFSALKSSLAEEAAVAEHYRRYCIV